MSKIGDVFIKYVPSYVNVLSRKLGICTRIAIREKRLKIVHSRPIYWKFFFFIEFHAGLKVKIAENAKAW